MEENPEYLNAPRCPVCNNVLHLWVTGGDVIRASCPRCNWQWTGG